MVNATVAAHHAHADLVAHRSRGCGEERATEGGVDHAVDRPGVLVGDVGALLPGPHVKVRLPAEEAVLVGERPGQHHHHPILVHSLGEDEVAVEQLGAGAEAVDQEEEWPTARWRRPLRDVDQGGPIRAPDRAQIRRLGVGGRGVRGAAISSRLRVRRAEVRRRAGPTTTVVATEESQESQETSHSGACRAVATEPRNGPDAETKNRRRRNTRRREPERRRNRCSAPG